MASPHSGAFLPALTDLRVLFASLKKYESNFNADAKQQLQNTTVLADKVEAELALLPPAQGIAGYLLAGSRLISLRSLLLQLQQAVSNVANLAIPMPRSSKEELSRVHGVVLAVKVGISNEQHVLVTQLRKLCADLADQSQDVDVIETQLDNTMRGVMQQVHGVESLDEALLATELAALEAGIVETRASGADQDMQMLTLALNSLQRLHASHGAEDSADSEVPSQAAPEELDDDDDDDPFFMPMPGAIKWAEASKFKELAAPLAPEQPAEKHFMIVVDQEESPALPMSLADDGKLDIGEPLRASMSGVPSGSTTEAMQDKLTFAERTSTSGTAAAAAAGASSSEGASPRPQPPTSPGAGQPLEPIEEGAVPPGTAAEAPAEAAAAAAAATAGAMADDSTGEAPAPEVPVLAAAPNAEEAPASPSAAVAPVATDAAAAAAAPGLPAPPATEAQPEKLNQFVNFLNGENPGACMFHAQMRLSVEGCQKLAHFLKGSARVRALSLSHNYLGDGGLRIICEGLKENKSVTALDLPDNAITDLGARMLAEAIKDNPSLTQLQLAYNKIGDEGAAALAKYIKHSTSLKKLGLSYNNIGKAGCKALTDAINSNQSLKHLQLLPGNPVEEKDAKALAKALKRNNKFSIRQLLGLKGGEE